MRNFEFFLDKLSELGRIEITCYSHGEYWDLHTPIGYNPLRENPDLRNRLIEMTRKNPQLPALFLDNNDVFFGALAWEDSPYYDAETDIEYPATEEQKQDPECWTYFLLGPASLHTMDLLKLHQYYRTYTDKSVTEKHPPVLSFARFLSMLQIAAMVLGKRTDEEEIIKRNHLDAGINAELEADQVLFSLRQEEEESAHHTYAEEQALLGYVREGRKDEASRRSMILDQQLGRMSQDKILQWRKVVTVAITLVSRAAIDGGMSPGEAYRLSDYYLQKSDICTDVPSLIACRNQAIIDFCDRVSTQKEHKKHSAYILRCREYIHTHYREKILLDEIAAELHLNSSYLSRLFSREMNVRLQDYIVQVRVERAANLLKYSDETIAGIGDYVGFPSQSHFGYTFKKITGMTPRQYRENHKNWQA